MIQNFQVATDPYVEPEAWLFEEILEQAVEDVKRRGAMGYTKIKSDRDRAEHFLFFDNQWFPEVCRRMGTTAEFIRARLWEAVRRGIIPWPKGCTFSPAAAASGPPSLKPAKAGGNKRRGGGTSATRAASPSNGNGKQARRQVRRGGEVRP